MSYVWWAVRGARLDAMCEVLERAQLVADPRWADSVDDATYACFTAGPWTFVLVRDGTLRLDEQLAFSEVVRLELDEQNEWSELSVRGGRPWSVYGASDDDHPRADGQLPSELAGLLDDDEVGTIPVRIAERLTGVDLEGEPKLDRVVRFSTQRAPIELESDEEPPEITVGAAESNAWGTVASIEVHGIIDAVACRPEALLVEVGHHVMRIDRERFPPVFAPVAPTPCHAAAPTPWGTELVALEDSDINSVLREGDGWIPLPFSRVGALRTVQDGVVVLPAGWSDGDAVPHVIRASAGKRVVERIDVPRMQEDDEDPAVAGFGDGSFLLSWQGATYHVRDGVPHRTDLSPLRYDADAATLASDGTLIVATDYVVWRAWSDGRTQPVEGFTEPYKVVRGPDDLLVIVTSDKETAFALWRMGDDRVARVTYDELEIEDPSVIYPRGDRLVVIASSVYEFRLDALPLRWLPRA